ncbi:type II methionyl aminopeptidase [Nanoarchaeota archaeon NZ13-N]|nr:MAG: type II methionyl aminopeptidase [Nanoarchaeota archaeon NZ13-N]
MIEELEKASKIARDVYNYSKSLLKPDTYLIEIAEKIEEKIIDLGGFPAFPVNLSINEIAAHYTPDINDRSILKEGDLIKVDIGVHVDGYIVDFAYTYEVNDNKYEDLVLASKEALKRVKTIIRKDIELGIIGKEVEETIKKYGYKPIYNLTGHKIERYLLHASINIPNYDNGSQTKISEGIYAVEPFATNGIGFVKDCGSSKIYSVVNYKPLRNLNARKILDNIYNKYKYLPFCKRWIYRDFKDLNNIDLIINYLIKEKVLIEYKILCEQSKGLVSQFETTFLINNGVKDLVEII